MVREVEDARALKPDLLHLVARVLQVYTPTVLVVAALAFVGLLAGSWLAGGEPDIERAVFAGPSVLVMGFRAPSAFRRRSPSCGAPARRPNMAS